MPSGFLSRLGGDDRRAVLAAGRPRRYRPGEALCREGGVDDAVVVVLEGLAKVTVTTANGHEAVLSVRGSGDVIGDLAAISERRSPRMATVTALTALHGRVLTGEEFRSLARTRAGVGWALLEVLAGRLRDADRRRAEFGGCGTAERLARVLVELVEEHGRENGDGHELGVTLSQTELAGLVAASRESVARALRSLRARGLVGTGRRHLVVLDVEGLATFANA